MEFQVGDVVCSKAGRDEGTFLVVVGIEGGYPLLCDGKQRPLERPKRKNPLHLAWTNTISICKRWKPIVHYAGRCAT